MAAAMDGECTVKRLHKCPDRVARRPDIPAYQTIKSLSHRESPQGRLSVAEISNYSFRIAHSICMVLARGGSKMSLALGWGLH